MDVVIHAGTSLYPRIFTITIAITYIFACIGNVATDAASTAKFCRMHAAKYMHAVAKSNQITKL